MEEFAGHQKMLNQHLFDLKKIEKQIEGDVAGDKTFTNDTVRKAEVFKRLQDNEQYQTLKGLKEFEDDQIVEINTILEVCKMNIKAYDIITRN
jgi:hypothetical protein